MKRSEINGILREAKVFLQKQKFYLPPFAYWSLQDWKLKGDECREIVENELGWDITDFGKGNFSDFGLILFTIRNGDPHKLKKGGKNYCEKIMIANPGQATPMHHHYQKIEDIINRGGGNLIVQIYRKNDEEQLSEEGLMVSVDGIKRTIQPGDKIRLTPGESVTLTPEIYHTFWAERSYGKVLIGEVSSVNDDHVDNKFLDPIGRFPEIEEDEEPIHLLYADYTSFLDQY